jgi:phosphatidylethanolamine-binding protein (PEBP) family uncharacterized protein
VQKGEKVQRISKLTSAASLLTTLVLVGCGGSNPSSTPNASSTPNPASSKSSGPFAAIAVSSPAVKGSSNAPLPARYTCDGKNISPPLEWSAVPAGTKEVAIVLINTTPGKSSIPFVGEWALTGVSPSVHKLAAGEVPPGAHVGIVGGKATPYSVCPAKGEAASYQLAVYALRPTYKPGPKFMDSVLLETVASGPTQTGSSGGGSLGLTYTRK